MKEHNEGQAGKPMLSLKNKAIILCVLAVLLIVTVLGVKAWHNHAVEQAYQQALRDAGANHQVVEVTPDMKVDAATIREVIAPAAKLISYEYFYTDADQYEKSAHFFGSNIKVPFTTDRSIFTYAGTISAGVDLSTANIEADDVKKLVTVTLGAPKVLAHQLDLDSFQIYDVKNSIFTTVNLRDYVDMQAALMKKQEEKLAVNTDFWQKLEENTKSILDGLIKSSGAAADYTVIYVWTEE